MLHVLLVLHVLRVLLCRWDRSPTDITSYPELEQMVTENKGRLASARMGVQAGGRAGQGHMKPDGMPSATLSVVLQCRTCVTLAWVQGWVWQ